MRTCCLLGAALAATFALPAQSPLTTAYAGGALLNAPAVQFFDLTVNMPLTFQQIDVNTGSAATTTGTIDVYWTPNTYVGNDTNVAAWTIGGSGPVTSAGPNLPSPCTLSPMTLPPGNYGIAVVFNGISAQYFAGNGTAVPGSGTNQTYSTTELTMRTGASANGVLGTAICCVPRVFSGSLHYTLSGSGTVATRNNYGTGCVARSASFYEHFLTTPSIDLSNTTFRMFNTGSGYVVVPGTATFVAPSGTATNLNLTDDSETTVTLAAAFPYPGGSTTTLNVCSNGHISTASNGAQFDYTPTPAELLGWANATWAVWRDMIPNASGNVWFEQVGTVAYITWLNVIGYVGTAAGTTPTTFQLQFDTANGAVDFVFGSLDTVSISTWTGGEGWIVGYSPGGASMDPGSVDLTTAVPASIVLPPADLAPLALVASARPIAGNTINLVTSNIGPTAPFGAVLLSLTQHNPGLPLVGLGMAGCQQYQGGEVTLLFLPLGASTVPTPLLVPNALGFHIYAQSFVYDPAAGLTVLGAISSNGVDLGIGNL